MKKLSIVIPVFNERTTILEVLDRVVRAKLPTGWEREIVVVDDCSVDGTSDVLSPTDKRYKLIKCTENGGKGAALKEGFKAVTGDYVLIQDADLEYNPDDYMKLLEPIVSGKTEVVFGSRTLGKNKVPLRRIFYYGGLLVTRVFNAFFGTRITDVATCYKVFPSKFIPDLANQPAKDFAYDVIELSYYLVRKSSVVEVPINYQSRSSDEGKKMKASHGFRCLSRIFTLFVGEKSRRPYLPIILTFFAFFLVFFLVYFQVSTLSSGDDHFFHFRFAQNMFSDGFFGSFQNFKAIYFSRMAQGNDYFMYYNFLFYLVILPFTFITPLFLGIKLYAVCAAAAAFTLLYWCIKKIHIKNPLVWTLVILALTNVTSIWRFFLSRPYALAPSLLLLLLYFLYKKNHVGVFVLSFAYLYWHSSTFFLPACVVIAYYVIELFYKEKGDWKNLVAGVGGTIAAIAVTYFVSSGFILFIKDTVFNIYWDTIVGKKVNIGEGMELYPIDFFNFVQTNALIFAMFVTALSVDIFSYIGYKWKKLPLKEYFADAPKERKYLHTTILVLTAGFFLGTVLISARFGDYFTFFAALYIALSFDYARRLITITGGSLIKQSIFVGLVIVLGYLFLSNMLFLEQRLARGQSAYEFYQTGTWLAEHSKPGDIVFESNWSWFPQLYYWSPKNYYSEGLEPRFTYNLDQKLYWLGVHIPNDANMCDQEICEDLNEKTRLAFKNATTSQEYAKTMGDEMAKVMKTEFKASYIVTSKDYTHFNFVLSNNKNFKLEQYDAAFGYVIFKVK